MLVQLILFSVSKMSKSKPTYSTTVQNILSMIVRRMTIRWALRD